VGKLLGQTAFLLNIQSVLPLPPGLAIFIANWLPWVELMLGVCLIMGIATQLAGLFSAVLIVAFIWHNSWMIALGFGYEPCRCLGVLQQVFVGKLSTIGSLYIDIGLLILALIIYFGYQGNLLNLRPWFLRRVERQMPEEGEVIK